MTPVLIGLLFTIGLALAVVGVVAYPHLRDGAPLLTPEGERLAREARQKAQELAGNAAGALVNRDRDVRDGYPGAGPPVPGRAPVPGSGQGSVHGTVPGSGQGSVHGTVPGSGQGSGQGARTGQALPQHGGLAPYPVPGGAAHPVPGPLSPPVPSGMPQATGAGPAEHPGTGQVPDDTVIRLDSTRLVWASPPPQLRPSAATPVPGTSQAGDPRTGPGQAPAAR